MGAPLWWKGRRGSLTLDCKSITQAGVPGHHCLILRGWDQDLCGQVHCVMWCSKWFQLWVFPKPVPTDTTSLWVVWEQLNQRMADTIYFYAIRQGNWMTTFTELLPQIKDFWELKDRETQFVKMLFTRWCFLTVMTKHGSTLNLKCQEREKRSNEHHCTFRSLLIYVKTGQITFFKKNWANNF